MRKISFHILTLFPEVADAYARASILGRAAKKGLISIDFVDIRKYSTDKHKTTDDRPYGGGPGMVMKAEPILNAVESVLKKLPARRPALRRGLWRGESFGAGGKAKSLKLKAKIIILSPRGKMFTDRRAQSFSQKYQTFILIAGRYEGIDARVKKILRAEELSVGPYTVTGGELPALIVVDAVTRRIPGVLGDEMSIEDKRAASGEMYTRPEVLTHGKKRYRVPSILLSGDHKKIEAWRGKRVKKRIESQ